MGQYWSGDVLLAPVALDNRTAAKTRPVIVIGTCGDGTIRVCPVSSRPSTDAPCLPITIDDFASGGLDLFSESYVMTTHVITIQSGQVIGKKGRVMNEFLGELDAMTQPPHPSGMHPLRSRGGRDRH